MRLKMFNSDQKNVNELNKNSLNFKKFFKHFLIIFLITFILNIYLKRKAVTNDVGIFFENLGFKIDTIEISGRIHTDKEKIVQIIRNEKVPFIFLNIRKLRQEIIKKPWVKDAIVERKFPNKLFIEIDEHLPIALLQTNLGHQLINSDGNTIYTKNIESFRHLPVISGKNSSKKYYNLLKILKTEPELFSEIYGMEYISERRWDIHLKSGAVVKLPEDNPFFAWTKFAKIQRENSIIKRDIVVIDLRDSKQLIIEPNLPVRGKGSKI